MFFHPQSSGNATETEAGMTVSSAASTSETDLIDVCWMFEQITSRQGVHADRSAIRRSVDEGARFAAELPDSTWSRWLTETATSLGFVARVVEGQLPELISLARDGMSVIVHLPDGGWRLLAGHGGRRILLMQPRGQHPIRTLRPRQISAQLQSAGVEGLLRCVVIEPHKVSAHGQHDDHHHASPLSRLISLMKAERTDIWVVVIFALVSGLLSMTTPLAVEALVSTVAFGRFLQPVIVLSLMLLVFLLFKAALKAMQTWVVELIQRRLFARLAAELAWRLPRTSLNAFHDSYPPELVNRFFDVVTIQKTASGLLLDGISLILNMAVGMTVLAFYHPWLLAFDFALVLLMLLVYLLGRGAIATSITESKCKYAMAAWFEDIARCRNTFRYDGAAEFALDRSDALIYGYLDARRRHFSVLMRQLLAILLVQALASTVLLAIGGWLVITGQLSLGQLVAAELIVAIVVDSFAKMAKHIESYYDLLTSVDKIGHLLDLPVERADGLLTIPEGSGIVIQKLRLPGAEDNPVSMEIRSGERVALVGSNTRAKSHLLDMLFGLREPAGGLISLHGADPRDLRPDVLRRHVVMVRNTEIFDGTIAENVHLERSDVSIADVRSALETVELMNLVQELPQGLNTRLSPDGLPLTPIQCRLLMVARAISGRPEVVLIDELLDLLPEDVADRVLRRITSADHSWKLILATSNNRLQQLMSRVIELPGESTATAAATASRRDAH
jgi:ABC-type bacteriocin/lantibiotic exporter with double-glycine peptidase domain